MASFPRVRLWRYAWRVMAWRVRRNLKIWAAQGEPVLVRGGVFIGGRGFRVDQDAIILGLKAGKYHILQDSVR